MRLTSLWLLLLGMLAYCASTTVAADYVGLTADQVRQLDRALAAAEATKVSPQVRAEQRRAAADRWEQRTQRRSELLSKLRTRAESSRKLSSDRARSRRSKRERRVAKWKAAADPASAGASHFNLAVELARLPAELREQAEANAAQFAALTASAPQGMPSLDRASFESLILSGARPYHTVVTINALTQQHKCDVCQKLDAALAYSAKHIQAHPGHAGTGAPVRFITVELAKQPDLASAFGVQPPATLVIPPALDGRRRSPGELAATARHRFTVMQAPSISDLTAFLLRATGVEVPLPSASVPIGAVAGGAAIIAAALAAVYFLHDKLDLFHRFTSLYAVLACAGYLYGVAGGMFNTLQKTPFSAVGRDGQPSYIAAGHMSQYGAESVLMGVGYFACAVVCVLLTAYAFDRSTSAKHLEVRQNVQHVAAAEAAAAAGAAGDEHGDSSATAKKGGRGGKRVAGSAVTTLDDVPPSTTIDDTTIDAVVSILPPSLGLQVVPFMFAALFITGWAWIVNIYTLKNRGYNYGRVW